MPKRKVSKIIKSLTTKGFQAKKGRRKHTKYTLYVNGKKTDIFTWISHSHGSDEYTEPLLNAMKKQIGLETPQEFDDFMDCPMSGEMLVSILVSRGKIRI